MLEKSFLNLAQDGVLSEVHEICRALGPLVLTMLEQAVDSHGDVLVRGKLLQRGHSPWPSPATGSTRPFRQACEFDAFSGGRLSDGSGHIFDDGTLSDEPCSERQRFHGRWQHRVNVQRRAGCSILL